MKIAFNVRFVRPSEIVAAVENGIAGAARLTTNVVKAVPGEIKHRYNKAKFELAASRIAAEDAKFETMSYEERAQLSRDQAAIHARATEIRLRRTKKDEAA